jgi:dTMP kinase
VALLLEIEGIDGSGKGTQAALLAATASARGLRVATFSFPTYDGNPFSRAVADYLNGAFGGADEVHPELAGLLYACDRWHTRPQLVAALESSDLVVLDRYVGSNLGHQGSKLAGAERERLLDWLVEVEYGAFDLPRPNLVVLLDAPPVVARERVGRKEARAYTTLEADIHEADATHTAATREIYLELAARFGWRVLATGDRGVDDLAAEIWSMVEPLL